MARFNFLALALATCFTTIAAHPHNAPRNTNFGCGVEPTADFLAQAAEFAAAEANVTDASEFASQAAAAATITIQTYFHVVARSTAASGGYVSQTQLTNQLAVMNSNYGKLSLS